MTSTETEKASLLLDFGSELHGGLKLVMGSSNRREPSLVRIRFGESVGEANEYHFKFRMESGIFNRRSCQT